MDLSRADVTRGGGTAGRAFVEWINELLRVGLGKCGRWELLEITGQCTYCCEGLHACD